MAGPRMCSGTFHLVEGDAIAGALYLARKATIARNMQDRWTTMISENLRSSQSRSARVYVELDSRSTGEMTERCGERPARGGRGRA